MKHIVGIGFVATALAAPALAATEPRIEATPDWVRAVPIPEADPKKADRPLQLLLVSSQSRYGDNGTDHYIETATVAQNPQGLAAIGTVALPWKPDQSELIVHKVQVLRAGKPIDLLAGGRKFTVLRRENRLEYAMLDGTLTAVLQPEGLMVGDILDVAFTIRRKPGRLSFSGENMAALQRALPVRHFSVRQIWPDGKSFQWRASPEMGKPKLLKTKLGNELALDLLDAVAPTPPADAPLRFQLPPLLQITEYSDWADVSRLLAPHFTAAQELGASSELKVEAAQIAAASPDPAKRAMAALRLVQDQIRYVALAMDLGGHIPASADETWSRKYGDCKGKTVTLIALLKLLGIEAEPVLVSSGWSEALNDRLPQLGLFDHVLVRATVDGRSYWLDGTRSGDRQLLDLASSPFGWGLPVRAAGASLERLPLSPPSQPLTEIEVTYDASQGIRQDVPVNGRVVFRGDLATGYRIALAERGKSEIRKTMDEFDGLPSESEIASFDFQSDENSGTFTYSFAGKAHMSWSDMPASKAQRFRFSNYVVEWDTSFDRPDGPLKDLPHALAYPTYLVSRETVILPNKGAGFTLDGKDLDATVAGTVISRKLKLENGTATAFSSFLRKQKEISAAEARAAKEGLEAVNADRAYVRSPESYGTSKAEIDAVLKGDPVTASGFLERGYQRMRQGENTKAIADFDQAIAKSPDWARSYANKAVALSHKGKLDEAEKAAAKAVALDEADFVAHQALGLVHAGRDRHQEAIASFTRSLELDSDNTFTLEVRARSYIRLRKFDEAVRDWEKVAKLDPSGAPPHIMLAKLAFARGDLARSLSEIKSAADASPNDFRVAFEHALLLYQLGRSEEATPAAAQAISLLDEQLKKQSDSEPIVQQRLLLLLLSGQSGQALKELDAVLARQPDHSRALARRCWVRAVLNQEVGKAVTDCSKALEYNVGYADAAESRAFARLRLSEYDAAISDFTDVISWQPKRAAVYFGRALAKLRKGDAKGAETDFAAARSLNFMVDAQMKSFGFAP